MKFIRQANGWLTNKVVKMANGEDEESKCMYTQFQRIMTLVFRPQPSHKEEWWSIESVADMPSLYSIQFGKYNTNVKAKPLIHNC